MRNAAYFFITTIAIVLTLIYGKNLLIPFISALLLWFLIRKIRHSIDKISFIQNRLPSALKNLIISLVMLSLLGFVSRVLLANINSLAKSYLQYEANVSSIINNINQLLNINLLDILKSHAGEFNFGNILKDVFTALSDLLGNAFIIIIYTLFIFLEETHFKTKITSAFSKKGQADQIAEVLNKIEKSITSYIGLKTLVSLITGIASYVVLMIVGVEAPVFWAALIFILNYIPTVGSLIGTVFPATFCLLQFGDFTPFLLILSLVGVIQIIVGNVLEPKLMGNSLNISSFVTIFALSFWGVIWGITGMILSIPITVIMVIIFSHFNATKPVAIMLSEKGKIG